MLQRTRGAGRVIRAAVGGIVGRAVDRGEAAGVFVRPPRGPDWSEIYRVSSTPIPPRTPRKAESDT